MNIRTTFIGLIIGVWACSATTPSATLPTSASLVRFEPNYGQAAAAGQFLARSRGGLAVFSADGVTFALPQGPPASNREVTLSVFKMTFGQSILRWRGSELGQSLTHYFLGAKTFHVPHYGSLRADLSTGVEVQFYGQNSMLKYDIVFAPGIDRAMPVIRFPGAHVTTVDGALHVTDGRVTMVHRPPVAYQSCGGLEQPVAAQYVMEDDGAISFQVGSYSASCHLVIDPVVVYGLSGGTGLDEAHDLATDGGNLVVAGTTLSTDLPLTAGTAKSGQSILIETFGRSGEPTATTVIGGTDGASSATGVAVDGAGRVSVVGWTSATDFPLVSQPVELGRTTTSVDAVVSTLSADLSTLLSSASFGGSARDVAQAVAVQGMTLYVTGETNSPDFPVKQPTQPNLAGGHDAFVLVLDDGKLVTSTYCGGRDNDGGRAIVVLGNSLAVGGITYSPDLPTSPTAVDSALTGAGLADGFIVRYNISSNQLSPAWTSYFGGDAQDVVTSLVIDSSGDLYVGGTTFSVNLPLKNAWRTQASGSEGFAAKIAPSGALLYSTYLGGNELDEITRIGLDTTGSLIFAGNTRSSFAADPSFPRGRGTDILVGALHPDGSPRSLVSTGGNGDDYASAMTVVGTRIWIAGGTTSVDLPLMNTTVTHAGSVDVFLMGLDLPLPLAAPTITSPTQGAQIQSASLTFVVEPPVVLPAPTITVPTQGGRIQRASVTLEWNAIPGALGYDVEIDGSIGKRSTWVARPFYSLRVTLLSGNHTARVRACVDTALANCGPTASVSFVVVGNTETQVPTFITPLPGSIFRSTIAFSWTPVSNATYELEVRDQNDERVLRIRVRDTYTIYTIGTGTYRATIRACVPGCGPSSSTDFAVTLVVPLTAPTGVSCTSAGTSLRCAWDAVQGADLYVSYVVQPGAGPGGGALSVAASQVSTTTMTTIVPPGRASVVVQACTGDGCGPKSPAVEVTITASMPAVPTLGTPVAGQTIDSGTAPPVVQFSWNRVAGDNGTNYRYRLYVQDFSSQEPALDVYTSGNYYAAYFNAGTRYDALVIATPLAGGPSTTGPAQGFAIRARRSPLAPTSVSPAHGDRVAAGSVRLQWTRLPSDPKVYQYFIGRSDGPSVVGSSTTNSAIIQLGPGRHTLAVRACLGTSCSQNSDVGWGPWSDKGEGGVSSFTVQ